MALEHWLKVICSKSTIELYEQGVSCDRSSKAKNDFVLVFSQLRTISVIDSERINVCRKPGSTSIYKFKLSNRNTRKREICSKLTVKDTRTTSVLVSL